MSNTPNQNLELQPSGQADWDSALNANFTILDRGYHGQFVAGTTINTGEILWVASGGIVHPYNANSLSLHRPIAISYKSVSSGETDLFLLKGVISSLDMTSGHVVPGEPFYVSASTPGFPVSSYSASYPECGIAIKNNQIYFNPKEIVEHITNVQSYESLRVGSTHRFTMDIGHRGRINRLDFQSLSHDLWTLKFFSGSAAVNSELLYETLSGGVNSLFIRDQAGIFYEVTDTSSPGQLYLEITVHSSATGVTSADFNMQINAERFR